MTMYLHSKDFGLYMFCFCSLPLLLKDIDNDLVAEKPKTEWHEHDEKLRFTNAKPMKGLNSGAFNRISNSKNVKKIWHTLELTHEGTN